MIIPLIEIIKESRFNYKFTKKNQSLSFHVCLLFGTRNSFAEPKNNKLVKELLTFRRTSLLKKS